MVYRSGGNCVRAQTLPLRILQALTVLFAAVPVAMAHNATGAMSPAQANFVLHCGGCHGVDGTTNAEAVPDLKHQVGYFLNFPEGRAYLSRLPNVAFSTLTDQELADALNYMVFVIGEGSVPQGAKPYQAAEVASLRRTPLTGAPLRAYRAGLVERLIRDYGAAETLRLYGRDNYGVGSADRR